jgi:hypothetical protein
MFGDGPVSRLAGFRLTGPHNEALTGAEFVDMAFPLIICVFSPSAIWCCQRVNDASRAEPSEAALITVKVEKWRKLVFRSVQKIRSTKADQG